MKTRLLAFLAMCSAIFALACSSTQLSSWHCYGIGATVPERVDAESVWDARHVGEGYERCEAFNPAASTAHIAPIETVVGVEYARDLSSAMWSCDVAFPHEQFDALTGYSVGPKQITRRLLTFGYGTKKVPRTSLYVETFDTPTDDLGNFLRGHAAVFRGATNPYAGDIRGRLQGLAWSFVKESVLSTPSKYNKRYSMRTFSLGTSASYAVCWQPLIEVEPDRSSWPKNGVWISKRAARTLVAVVSVKPKARQWDDKRKQFIDVDRGDATVYTCQKEIGYKDKLPTSDGWEPGPLQHKMRNEQLVIGPISHADSQMEAALRHDAVIQEKILVGYAGECWPLGAAKPAQPSNWSGQFNW